MATLSHKNYPKKSNMSQLNYNYEYSDYNSCTEGMSSDEEEEIDNVFLNECVNDEINNSDDSWTDESDNVEDDTDFSYASAPKKKKQLKKTTKIQRGKEKPNKVVLSSTQPVLSSVY